jgi:putative two-component system response regulator
VGEDIPLPARIVSIADIYDALASKRVYKDAYSHEKCVEIIRSEGGKHLDPAMVEVFLSVEREFKEIAARFSDAWSEQDEDKDFMAGLSSRPTTPAEDKLLNSVLELGENTAESLVSAG